MEWDKLLSTKRFKIENEMIVEYTSSNVTNNPSRSEYQQDHDRIVFSRAFRRLGRKTQVHPLALNDHTHNRLTHSVEVGAVGRSLGVLVAEKLKADGHLQNCISAYEIGTIIQVACLAHDIGNPPFGHIGEDALREWFKNPKNNSFLSDIKGKELTDLQTYEGNAHALRILCTTEMYRNIGGMRISSAIIGTLLKYPWTSDKSVSKGKFNIYQSEINLFKNIATELGLIEKEKDSVWSRHPLSYLMEAADDICYSVLDLEDAVEMEIIKPSEFGDIFKNDQNADEKSSVDDKQKCAILRSKFIGDCINFVANEFIKNYDFIIKGNFPKKDFFENSDDRAAIILTKAKSFAAEKIYIHPAKVRREVGAYTCLHHLLSLFIPVIHDFYENNGNLEKLTTRQKIILKLLDQQPDISDRKYQSYLNVLDFIGGMTDNYAITLSRETSGLGGI